MEITIINIKYKMGLLPERLVLRIVIFGNVIRDSPVAPGGSKLKKMSHYLII